jgi:hypothetical protein
MSLKETFLISPLSVRGCQLWLDAADVNGNGTSVANGASVTSWTDKSGNGRNATATTAPTYDLPTKNILFNGTNQFFNLPNGTYPFGNTPYSIFLVAYTRNSANPQWILAGGNESTNQAIGVIFFTTNAVWHSWWINEYRVDNSIVNNVPAIVNISYSTSRSIVVNGGTASLNSPGAARANPNGPNFIGRRPGDASQYFNGGMGECIIYNSEITTSDRQKIEGYLAWKWGLTGSLPSTHPFKNYRPINGLSVPIPISYTNPKRTVNLDPFDPRTISGCQLWLDGADTSTILLSGSTISGWNDKSGNRRNASNITGIPVLSNNNLIQRQGIFFNGASYMTGGFPYSSNTLSWFLVGTIESDGDAFGRLLSFGDPSQYDFDSALRMNALSRENLTNEVVTYRSNYISRNLFISYSTPFFYSSVIDGTSNTPFLNGRQGTGAATSGNFGFSTFGLSASFGLNVQRNKGFLFEVIVYSTALTTAQRQQVEGYLAWKWGLTSSLPANHPYRTPIAPFPPISIPRKQTLRIFSPRNISGCQVWLDAADPSTLFTDSGGTTRASQGQTIARWNDKSGNGINATQATLARQPRFVSSGIQFVAANNNFMTWTIPFSQNQSVFVVLTQNATGGAYLYARSTALGGGPSVLSYTNRLRYFDATDDVDFQNGTVVSGRNLVAYVRTQGVSVVGTYMGSQVFSIPQGNSTNASAVYDYLGSSEGVVNFYDGILSEFIFYNAALRLPQRQQIEGYLAWKWGLVANLPSTHPFKLFPPSP